VAPWRIRVILIEPGAIASPIWTSAAADRLAERMPDRARELYAGQIAQARKNAARSARHRLSPAAAAAAIARALTDRRPRPPYLLGRDALAASVIARLPYRLRFRLTAARR